MKECKHSFEDIGTVQSGASWYFNIISRCKKCYKVVYEVVEYKDCEKLARLSTKRREK